MMPAHVIVLETDASMYCVVGSARILRSMLAQPVAIDQTICSPLTTANVAPGVPIARTRSRMNDSTSDALAERRKVNGATAAAAPSAARVTKGRRLRPFVSQTGEVGVGWRPRRSLPCATSFNELRVPRCHG